MLKQFKESAIEPLGYYVYGLFDPDKLTMPFYIGKGKGNRVFSHADGVAGTISSIENSEEELLSAKNEIILNIQKSGKNVHHVIFRWGLEQKDALILEATLIDMVNYLHENSLTNKVSGHGVAQGFQVTEDLAQMLNAEEVKTDEPIMIIKIEKRWSELLEKYDNTPAKIPVDEIQKATEGDWRINTDRAGKAKCVFAVARGLVRAVFIATDWKEVSDKRKRFTAQPAPEYKHFVGQSVAHLSIRGNQNPIRYENC